LNRVDGKVALVTGGGRGIGKVSCELLAQAGAKVVVTDINPAAADVVANEIVSSGGVAIAVQHDVANENDWKNAVGAALERYGKLDVLVNNAGMSLFNECKDTSLEDWRRTQSVNLEGVFLGVRSGINAMIGNEGVGSIINIASIGALLGGVSDVSYAAAKSGVRMLTKAAAVECGTKGYNIRINTIYPGTIDSPMNDVVRDSPGWRMIKKLLPIGRLGLPIDIARGVLFLASDDSSFMTGSDLVIDGGATAGASGDILGLFDHGGPQR